MGQRLHGSARTTAAVRRAIQQSQESLATLAKRDDLNPKTVAQWQKRTQVHNAPIGPKHPSSAVLTLAEEALIVAFRKYTLLLLDDCLYALQATRPHGTRSARHRCLQRRGISYLPEMTGEKTAKKQFTSSPIGYFHIDIAEVRTDEGKLSLFVAIDRTCTFASAERHEAANTMVAAQFLRNWVAAVPYKLHTVLTDNGIQFTNRTRKDATVKTYHDQTHHHLKKHLQAFLMAYNFAKRLKTFNGLTPFEDIGIR